VGFATPLRTWIIYCQSSVDESGQISAQKHRGTAGTFEVQLYDLYPPLKNHGSSMFLHVLSSQYIDGSSDIHVSCLRTYGGHLQRILQSSHMALDEISLSKSTYLTICVGFVFNTYQIAGCVHGTQLEECVLSALQDPDGGGGWIAL
jgi:hypothetical protein